ncbi:DUF1146 family protein [Bacillus solimangrovi]|uniref:DUF1146 domain-containing protein n=1 Tax=Bacillus solimangrovi TaxID=1305675 RepID=A0A1E5LGZ6_9BACI|nr:DUF1146 family protein [Bacillus solimangrovi]OEH93350.1 hypothetical protein BFG57_12455 [Bacillus solimangrovi]
MEVNIAQQAMLGIIVHLAFFAITWWALQGIKIEMILKKGKVGHARVLLILLTITIGSAVSNFFLDYLFWSRQIPNLF